MVLLVIALQTFEDLDRLRHRRLADLDLLEAAGQGAVALERGLVLAVRRRADAAQLPRGDGGLEDVRGVHRAARHRAGADDRVDLVDEEDGVLLLQQRGDDRLQPLLELAAVFRPGQHRAHVERVDLRVLQHLGDFVALDLQRQPLGDGGLADARLADEERVVLPPPAEDLDCPLELRPAADERIDLPLLGALVEVHRERLQRIAERLRAAFLVGRGERGARHVGLGDAVREEIEDVDLVHALRAEEVDGLRALGLIDRGEHLPGVDFLLPRRLRVQLRVLHDALQHGREDRLDLDVVGHLLDGLGQEVVELLLEEVAVAAAVAHDRGHLAVVQQREEEVLDGDVLVAALERLVEGEFESLLERACDHGLRRCRTNAHDEPPISRVPIPCPRPCPSPCPNPAPESPIPNPPPEKPGTGSGSGTGSGRGFNSDPAATLLTRQSGSN